MDTFQDLPPDDRVIVERFQAWDVNIGRGNRQDWQNRFAYLYNNRRSTAGIRYARRNDGRRRADELIRKSIVEEFKEMIEKSYEEMCPHEACSDMIRRKAYVLIDV